MAESTVRNLVAGLPIEIGAAQTRWRAVNAPHLVALVRAGATFEKAELVERPDGRPRGRAPRASDEVSPETEEDRLAS